MKNFLWDVRSFILVLGHICWDLGSGIVEFFQGLSWRTMANIQMAVMLVMFGLFVDQHFKLMDQYDRHDLQLAVNEQLQQEVQRLTNKPPVVKTKIKEVPVEVILTEITWKGKPEDMPMAFANKNPLNVKCPDRGKWKGQIGTDAFGHAQFRNWEDGFRAGSLTLKNYLFRHQIETLEGIIDRFAEGNKQTYVTFLSKRLKLKPDEKFNLLSRLPELLQAMSRFETGYEFPEQYFNSYDIVPILVSQFKTPG